MKLVLLPGKSPNNYNWIYQVRETLGPLFDETYVQEYRHWGPETDDLDILDEENLLEAAVRYWDPESYVVFAKSAGALIAMKGMAEGSVKPKKCLFVGTALYLGEGLQIGIDEWMPQIDTPIRFIQNAHDPAGYAEHMKTRFDDWGLSGYEVIELEGESHDYKDLDLLKQHTQEFLLS